MTLLEELEATVQDVAERIGPAVVGLGRGWGVGSGVVVAPGRVLTNAHNLRHGHDESTVTFVDGRRAGGRVAAADADLDIAVIEVDTGDVEPIEWAATGSSSRAVGETAGGEALEEGNGGGGDGDPALAIGRTVLALSNPGGRGLRVTPGFVSSTARSFRGPRGRRFQGAIEHTAPLPRGSSGGPLVDSAGKLIGINSVRVDGGLILAIPAGDTLQAAGRGTRPRRGAEARPSRGGDRAAAGRPQAAPRGRAARARRGARARGRGRESGRSRRDRAWRSDRRRRRPRDRADRRPL